MPLRRAVLLVAALVATAATASACTDVNGTNGKNFVTSDGVVIEYPAADRGDAVDISGESLTGDGVDVADWRGDVVVLNVWGAWCTECIAEAPTLVAAAGELPAGTHLLGIDVRDLGKDSPLAFERRFAIPYPSLYDTGSESLLQFPAPFTPRDIPSTVVLDREGRVAALVRGALPSKLTLVELVQKVADERG